MRIRFAWSDCQAKRDAAHTFRTEKGAASRAVPTGRNVTTRWVEFEPSASP